MAGIGWSPSPYFEFEISLIYKKYGLLNVFEKIMRAVFQVWRAYCCTIK